MFDTSLIIETVPALTAAPTAAVATAAAGIATAGVVAALYATFLAPAPRGTATRPYNVRVTNATSLA